MTPPLVIVGASYAGTQFAASARAAGFDAPIVMIGDEPHAPYHRPPLSKGLLTGATTLQQLVLRSPDFFTDNAIDLRLGVRAQAIDTAARTVALADGSSLEYQCLMLATGARPRALPLPGANLRGVLQLRTLDDALALAEARKAAAHVVVIGGGFIGLEVAAALRTSGADVTVVESQRRLLARTFLPAMSGYVERFHRARGVQILLDRGVRALHGSGGVEAVELDDGRRLPCDLVVLGIGVVPNIELAQAAGIACDNGILTDAGGRTSAPNVLAAGDVANTVWPGGRARLESIQAANDGARAAAAALLGLEPPAAPVPWFWSDQFELKFQMAGLATADDTAVLRGDMAADKFTLYHLRDGAIAAAHSVNKPAEHLQARKLIASGARVPPSRLADPAFDLKPFCSA